MNGDMSFSGSHPCTGYLFVRMVAVKVSYPQYDPSCSLMFQGGDLTFSLHTHFISLCTGVPLYCMLGRNRVPKQLLFDVATSVTSVRSSGACRRLSSALHPPLAGNDAWRGHHCPPLSSLYPSWIIRHLASIALSVALFEIS